MKTGRALTLALLAAVAPLFAAEPAPAAEALDRAVLAARVRAEFVFAWEAYKRLALGHDELRPMSRAPKDWHAATLLMTPVDALDTMLVMGLEQEAEKTKTLILRGLSFDKDIEVKNFEITIRLLGGLLSSYQMTGDKHLLALAEDLGNRLLPVFNTPTGMPFMYVNLKTGRTSGVKSNPAEIGTLILEFGTLAHLTKREAFYDKPKKALVELFKRRVTATGLVGEEIDVTTGRWTSPTSHIGGGIDSYYEYLMKCELLFNDKECGDMWRHGAAAVSQYLADDGSGGLWYGESDMTTGKRTSTTFGALHAFFPAVLALGGDVTRARRLQDSVFRMWTLRGIEPEVLDYSRMKIVSAGYQLRPEMAESAYILYRSTKDPRYLEMGRVFFEDIVRYCRTDNGYTTLKSVETKEKGDLMPSYFLAETLKYLYLLFAPEPPDFDKVVFSTEAHPLRRTW